MAILANELASLRRGVCEGISPAFNKTQINLALNAGKDWIVANKVSATTAIETAVPGVFSNELKKKIYAYLFDLQFQEDK